MTNSETNEKLNTSLPTGNGTLAHEDGASVEPSENGTAATAGTENATTGADSTSQHNASLMCEWETRTELMEEENFEPVATATGLVDHNGGVIESHETGVSLFVPPGALADTGHGPVQITFEVGANPNYVPDQEKDENLVTPMVSCGPVGLEFRTPVYLRMPRTSGVDPLSWSLKSGRSGSNVWDTTAIRSEEIMVSDENFVSIPLDYF